MNQITCEGKDYSLYNPSHFKLIFDKIPETVFWCQRVTVPGLDFGVATSENPVLKLKHPGEKLMFSPLNVSILLDKKWKSYREITDWMFDLSVTNRAVGKATNCQLMMGEVTYFFEDVFPTSVSPIELAVDLTDAPPITFNVQFEYNAFEIR